MTVRPTPGLERVRVLGNERVAEGVGLITLEAPRCAASVRPGQFVHLRVNTHTDTILRRPFSIQVCVVVRDAWPTGVTVTPVWLP